VAQDSVVKLPAILDVELGLLLNFDQNPQIKRLVFANEKKKNLRPSALTFV